MNRFVSGRYIMAVSYELDFEIPRNIPVLAIASSLCFGLRRMKHTDPNLRKLGVALTLE